MKFNIKKIMLNSGILTLLTTPILFENIKLNNNEYQFAKMEYSKEQLYDEENISLEANQVELKTSMCDILNYISMVEQYCNIFGLDSDLVVDKIVEYTNNFTSEEFLNNNNIYDYGITFDNKEQSIIYFIRDINNNYTKHGFDDSIFVDTDYVQTLECEEMIEKYSEIFEMDKKIPMAITYTECHYTLSSYNFNVRNNPAGMGHRSFRNLETGIIYHIINLKYNYCSFGLNDKTFFRNAQSKYCPDNDGSWITFNENYYDILSDDYYFYLNQRLEEDKVLVR